MKKCSVENCENKYHAKGYCQRHYIKMKAGRKIKGPDAHAPNGSGCIDSRGYKKITVNGKATTEHRMVMENYIGRKLLNSESVHHKNGDRLDNRIENLELWSRYQPNGQRVNDKISWAKEILTTYTDYNDEEWRLP